MNDEKLKSNVPSKEEITELYKIIQRNENSIVLVTELKNKAGEHLIVPIALDRQNGKVNRITTIYGKKNLDNYLEANLSNIIALNEKKADNLLSDIGFQLPKSTYEAVIRYDDSIAYSVDNVKHPVKENQRENQHDDISAEEIEKRTSFKALYTDKDKVGRIIGINLPASPEQSKELIPQKKPKGKKISMNR